MAKLIPGADIDSDDLPRWDVESKTLTGGKKSKIRRLLKDGLIKMVNKHHFQALPIKGYNKTTYDIKKENGAWGCNCQGYAVYGDCNHRKAVFLWIEQNTEKI
jgi:hypothetical protein